MKRIIIAYTSLVLSITIILSGCGFFNKPKKELEETVSETSFIYNDDDEKTTDVVSTVEPVTLDTATSDTAESDTVDFPTEPEKVDNTFKLKYYKTTYYSDGKMHYYVIIENISSEPAGIVGNGKIFNYQNEVMVNSEMKVDCIAPGEKAVGMFEFNTDINRQTVYFDFKRIDVEKGTESAYDILKTEQIGKTEDNIFKIANIGKVPICDIQAYCLAINNDGKIKSAINKSIGDMDKEIKPGEYIDIDFDLDADADYKYEVYVNGKKSVKKMFK